MLIDISTVTGAIMVVIAFIGSVGNFLTLFVIIRYRPLHDVTGMFLANLAVADLLQSIFGMPLIATSAFLEKWIFGDTLCVISGVTNSLFCITSMLTLAAISMDRCLAIVYPLNHHALLTFPRAKVVLMYIWAHALLVALLPAFGWSRYVYLSYEFICTVQWEHNKAYTIFLSTTSFAVPLTITVLSYSSVMKVACHQARETPPITVGEIEAKLDHVTTPNEVNVESVVTDVSDVKMQVDNAHENMINKAEEGLRRSFYATNDTGIVVEKAEMNTQIAFPNYRQKEGKFDTSEKRTTDNITDAEGTGLTKWTAERQKHGNSLTRLPKRANGIKTKRETGTTAQVIENDKNSKPNVKSAFSILRKRKVSVDPVHLIKLSRKHPELTTQNSDLSRKSPEVLSTNAGLSLEKPKSSPVDSSLYFTNPELSRKLSNFSRLIPEYFYEDPELYRLRRAWTSENLFGAELGIIPEEDETTDSQRGLRLVSSTNCTESHGHLARLREWMAVRITNKEKAESILHRKKEMKVVLTLAVVNGTFVLCWLPHFIGIMCLTFTNGLCPFSNSFFIITTALAMLNSGCNPFIYTLTYRKFRKAFRVVLPWFRSNRTANVDCQAN